MQYQLVFVRGLTIKFDNTNTQYVGKISRGLSN